MKNALHCFVAAWIGLLSGGWQAAFAAESNPTTLTVPGLDCPSCAKKVATRLTSVPGVARAEPDLTARTLKVTPQGSANLSPKALWEAAEKAGHAPSKLEGPHGVFTSKPAY